MSTNDVGAADAQTQTVPFLLPLQTPCSKGPLDSEMGHRQPEHDRDCSEQEKSVTQIFLVSKCVVGLSTQILKWYLGA